MIGRLRENAAPSRAKINFVLILGILVGNGSPTLAGGPFWVCFSLLLSPFSVFDSLFAPSLGSCCLCSVSQRGRFRRLHDAGFCFRVPGLHFLRWEDLGPDVPDFVAARIDARCADCFPAAVPAQRCEEAKAEAEEDDEEGSGSESSSSS